MANKKGGFELSVNFLVILIICIVIFGFSIYIVKKFFTHAETIKMTYDERTEREIESLLDDGSRVAIPYDKKAIGNGDFKTFGIGVLNTLGTDLSNVFDITIVFNKAFDRRNDLICESPCSGSGCIHQSQCGYPDTWLQSTQGSGVELDGVTITKSIKNNEQEKFLLGVGVKDAPKGTYIFDLSVTYDSGNSYDSLHKLYVDVP